MDRHRHVKFKVLTLELEFRFSAEFLLRKVELTSEFMSSACLIKFQDMNCEGGCVHMIPYAAPDGISYLQIEHGH